MNPTSLPFEFPFQWDNESLREGAGVNAEAAAILKQRDRDLEDYLADPIPTVAGCSVFQHGNVQTLPDNTFTTLDMTTENWSDGNFDLATNIYTVPVSAVYSSVVRVRLQDNLASTFTFGAGVHTSNSDGPWFLWAVYPDISVGTGTDRGSVQAARIAHFQAGDQLRAYAIADRGTTTQVVSAGFDVYRLGVT